MRGQATRRAANPLHVFNFEVEFRERRLSGGPSESIHVCSGAFSECTGLEATMEPKVIKAGGHNYGAIQRAGPVTFATVVLKRGMTARRDLWRWFELSTRRNAYTYRLAAIIRMCNHAGDPVVSWQLERALPIKFKAADLNARSTEVGIEELHLAHEGLSIADESSSSGQQSARASGAPVGRQR